ncbi:DNA-formamidopyrimidine glycosylase family protein [Actinomarinicola tropica]|uniref:Formamidopyrimidine-DNA glycosylase n=1 Tax=Actinomarinicola tropica TaxID=2789776 RepID=A0A5Q2RKG9_9ACTN|nr:DNA-formamidopyrimidine glycosylase family protein [Actinomarinicola tropica]QGG95071.1 formamidopyrimidine-DNA glycosylase [Actinomarinicola tropica]
MPEILEVERYRRSAEPVVGRVIDEVHAPDTWFVKRGDPDELRAVLPGHRVTGLRRIGKLLLVDTDGPVLGLRFGMTGRLIVDGDASIDQLEYSSGRDLPEWHRFGLGFSPSGSLAISDPRRLGGVELDPDESRLGVDALDASVDELGAALAGSRAAVKARLMDQAHVAGLGNLLTDETLWRAGIDPARPASAVEGDDLAALHAAMHEVLSELGERGGSHTGDLHLERTAGGRCPRDGAELVRRTIGGRTTWSCPAHQV